LPIFAGGVLKSIVDWKTKTKNKSQEDEDLSKGNLFATGLVAGGALAGVVVALLSVDETVFESLQKVNAEHGLSQVFGNGGYQLLGTLFFVALALILYRIAVKKEN
jgi:hypothetical protein